MTTRFSSSKYFLRPLKILICLLLVSPSAFGQKKLDLDDVSIKGELLNDGRLRMHNREPAAIDDRVKYRKNYRNEILESGVGNAQPTKGSTTEIKK